MHSKKVLAEFIYELNKIKPFEISQPLLSWSNPKVGFVYDHSLPWSFINELANKDIITEGTDNVIAVLADWEKTPEGIIFTDRAIYVNSPKNKAGKEFKVRYNDITSLYYADYTPALWIRTDNLTDTYTSHLPKVIDTKLWNKLNIHDFLQFATEEYEFYERRRNEIKSISIWTDDGTALQQVSSIMEKAGK